MSIGVLFVGTMLVCCLGLITGGPSDEEQKRYVINSTRQCTDHHTCSGINLLQLNPTPLLWACHDYFPHFRGSVVHSSISLGP